MLFMLVCFILLSFLGVDEDTGDLIFSNKLSGIVTGYMKHPDCFKMYDSMARPLEITRSAWCLNATIDQGACMVKYAVFK